MKRMKYRFEHILLGVLLVMSGCKGHSTATDGTTTDSLTAQEAALDQDASAFLLEEEALPEENYRDKGPEYDRSGFAVLTDVCPDVMLDIRYYSTYNFTGRRVPGYEEPIALLSKEAAKALKAVSDELKEKGYRLKIFDAYRPQIAVDEFKRWARIADDTLMRSIFYPEYPKSRLFPEQFIASKSGHSRGSTVDLTLVDAETGQEVDMGSSFDYMGAVSCTALQPGQAAGKHAPITETQYANRRILLQTMNAHGWRNYEREWWHYTLRHEPYPNTYFNFPVRR